MIVLISDSSDRLSLEYSVDNAVELKSVFRDSSIFYRQENISSHNESMKKVLSELASQDITDPKDLREIRQDVISSLKSKGSYFLDDHLDLYVGIDHETWCGPVNFVYLNMIDRVDWGDIFAELSVNSKLSKGVL